MNFSSFLRRVGAACVAGLVSLGAQAAVTTQLGFLVDASGSITAPNFTIMRNGYVAAVNAMPTDGSIELTVYSFSSSTVQVVAPTVLTAASKAGILASINAMAFTAGITATGAGITAISSAMLASAEYNAGLRSIINIATDGVPNDGTGNPQQTAINAATAARNAGIDALTAEGLGAQLDVGFLQDIVFSPIAGPCTNCGIVLADGSTPPNPMTSSPWVLRVNDFRDFERAMLAKVQAVVNVPEPSALALASLALLGLGLTRRRTLQA